MRRLLFISIAALAICSTALAGGAPVAGLGEPPRDLAQSWLASFRLSGHVFNDGDRVTGTVAVQPIGRCGKGNRCVSGVQWPSTPGLELVGCTPRAGKGRAGLYSCRWKAMEETDGWQVMQVGIVNDVGSAHSDDYYLVIDNTVRVISGTVRHPYSGRGLAGVPIQLFGPKGSLTTRTSSSGFYSAVLRRKGVYNVTYGDARKFIVHSPSPVRAVLGSKATADFTLRRKHTFEFGLRADNGSFRASARVTAGPGRQLIYRGQDWDESGSPMQLLVPGRDLPSSPATADPWSGMAMPLEAYPDDRCRVTVRASQDRTKRSATAFAPQVEKVLFAGGPQSDVGVRSGRRTATGGFVCQGESKELHGQATAVYLSLRNEAGYHGMAVHSPPKQIKIAGDVFAPWVEVPLADGSRKRVAGPGGGDTSTPNWNGSQVNSIPGELGGGTALSGRVRTSASLHVAGHLRLDGGFLYVPGDVTIDDGLAGTGAIIAGGSITIRGAVDLESDGANALRAGGPIVLTGK